MDNVFKFLRLFHFNFGILQYQITQTSIVRSRTVNYSAVKPQIISNYPVSNLRNKMLIQLKKTCKIKTGIYH